MTRASTGHRAGRALDNVAAAVRHYWYPLAALVRRELKKRYVTTMLGVGWTILQPLALLVIYVFVFGFILRSGKDPADAREFAFYMLAGILPFFAIAEGLQRACTSLREDRALLEREVFPAEVVPATRVVSASVGEAVGLLLLAVFAMLSGRPPSGWILLLPLLVALRILMTCGIAWVLSTLAVFVADLTEVLSFALTALLFLTPIFYPADALPDFMRWTLHVNPLHHLVESYRSVLIAGRAPFPEGLYVIAWAAVFAATGWWFFRKTLERGKDFL